MAEFVDDNCTFNPSDYSTRYFVLHTALYNLSVPCPFEPNSNSGHDSGIWSLDAPFTFFIQVFRLSVAACAIIAILALYNSIEVLGKIVYSIASCSIHWIIFLFLIILKCIVLLVFLPIAHQSSNDKHIYNEAGFIFSVIIQLITTLMLYICLEHERRFRSPDFASISSIFSKDVPSTTKRQLFFNWPRALALFFVTASLLTFIVLVSYKHPHHTVHKYCRNVTKDEPAAFGPLVWVWLLSAFKVRMSVFAMGICLLFIRRENFKLTVPAKVYLVLGLLFSVFEDIPNSVVTVIPFKTYNTSDNNVCIGKIFNLYDLMQFFGVFSLISFILFVRSQYLRVEQESKLSVVGDMQKLLQVNGRRDVKFY